MLTLSDINRNRQSTSPAILKDHTHYDERSIWPCCMVSHWPNAGNVINTTPRPELPTVASYFGVWVTEERIAEAIAEHWRDGGVRAEMSADNRRLCA